MRDLVFTNGEYYHIFIRGVDKRKIFIRKHHYEKFIATIEHLMHFGTAQQHVITRQNQAFQKKLSLICYCLMPNHYHFLIRQLEDEAISDFMHRLNTSYTKNFNLDRRRTGRLFEHTFKAVHIENEDQLLHVSRYIHLNPLVACLIDDLNIFFWSSFLEYIGKRESVFCEKREILQYFPDNSCQKYREYVIDYVDYARSLQQIKKYLFD